MRAVALHACLRPASSMALHAARKVSQVRRTQCAQLGDTRKSPARGGALRGRACGGDYFVVSPLTCTSTRRFGCRHAISAFMFF